MKTMITGATGWLGSHLTGKLNSEGYHVTCLLHPSDSEPMFPLGTRNIKIIRGDLSKKETLLPFFKDAEGATLFHCAGIIHARPKVLHQVNYEGTKNLIYEAYAAGVGKIVYVSSNSPAGFNDRRGLFTEDRDDRPYMAYGRSKAKAEELLRRRAGCIIIRPTWFYGPCQPARQMEFFRMIRRGKAPIVGDGNNLRSMTYVGNLVQALVLTLGVEATGQTYWISDERAYTMNEIVGTVEDVLCTEFGIVCDGGRMRLPAITGKIAQCVDWGLQSFGLYNQKVHVLGEMGESIACSVNKAKRELGYAPEVSLYEGMKLSIQDLLDRGETI